MGCTYSLEDITIPGNITDKVQALITKHNLEGILELDSHKDTHYVCLTDSSMSYSTANEIEDSFLPELALLLKGTEFDGQVLDSDCDGDHSTFIILDGKVRSEGAFLRIIDRPDIEAGKEITVSITHKALGIGKGKVVLLD
jgi:hypothetical protein